MTLFIFFLYLTVGIPFYLIGMYIRKHPYSQITKDAKLKKMATPETAKRYENRLNKAYRFFGLFCATVAIAQFGICSDMLLMITLFISLTAFIVYTLSLRRIITGKLPTITIVVLSLILLSPCVMIGAFYIEPIITFSDKSVTFSGFYGETVSSGNVKDIYIADTLPNIALRSNGYALESVRKGYFQTKYMQPHRNVKLLLHSSAPPFVYIRTIENKYIILNFRKKEKTMQIYEQLKQFEDIQNHE